MNWIEDNTIIQIKNNIRIKASTESNRQSGYKIKISSHSNKDINSCKTANTIPATLIQLKETTYRSKQVQIQKNELDRRQQSFRNHTNKSLLVKQPMTYAL